ncbi:hypothetical protein NAT51_07745 [Flavobacterium amniphilum]|uniref:hypothetical protein n=1 Tax=Flavobacterium amniphilum TaxID=1834035 RepID=UPI002029CD4B|nr:hypothetical protein [Flavobacterium amniphilum]MCL9805410.1 hypothetical protein [Flavobacterium amniphilum]
MKQIEKHNKTSVFALFSISIGLLYVMLENYNFDSINFGVAFESIKINATDILFYSIGYITPLIILLISSKKILLWTDKKKMTEICLKIILILLLYNALIKLLYFLMISLTNTNHHE